jgi:hypothetical protein
MGKKKTLVETFHKIQSWGREVLFKTKKNLTTMVDA